MEGLDYAGVLQLGRERELAGHAFTLHVGPWEIGSVPFATLATLGDDPGLVRGLVDECFMEPGFPPGDLSQNELEVSIEALRGVETSLATAEHRLDAESASRSLVLRELVCRWLEAVGDALGGLGAPTIEHGRMSREKRAQRVLAEYRRRAWSAASALIQLLPVADPAAAEARRRLVQTREWLMASAGFAATDLREPAWFLAETPGGELTAGEAATWGIP